MANKVILKPVVSEKSYTLAEKQNKYVFFVDSDATKIEVEKALREEFKVTPLKVNITNTRGKRTKFGKSRIEGRRSNQKKATATLAKGEKIELFEAK